MFTLEIKSPPSGAAYWWADYMGSSCYSGWLSIGEVWNCPYGAYDATDLHIWVVDAGYNTLHDKTGLGPLRDDCGFVYNCSDEMLRQKTRIAGFSINPTSCRIGDRVVVAASLEQLNGMPIPGRVLNFIDFTLGSKLWGEYTDSEGRIAKDWYPQSQQMGSHGYYVNFDGDWYYELSGSWLITVNVSEVAEPQFSNLSAIYSEVI